MSREDDAIVGGLHFSPTFHGTHVRVVVRGYGEPGQRPLLGELVMTPTEWSGLHDRDEEASELEARASASVRGYLDRRR